MKEKRETAFTGCRCQDAAPGPEAINLILGQTERKRLLLHSCCGPCSTACIERLAPLYEITVFYYNPCITEREEYEKRKAEQIRFITAYKRDQHLAGLDFIEGDYEPEEYLARVRGLEGEPEGGARCAVCFTQRLTKAAEMAKKLEIPGFTTTLTVSPHKNYELITKLGQQAGERYGVEYLPFDFKKKAGFQRSIQLSHEYGLYRQNYCGCRFSKRD